MAELSTPAVHPDAEKRTAAKAIAPLWHTALIVLLILATSVLGSRHGTQRSMAGHHVANYSVTIVWEWVLAGIAYWGIRIRRVPVRQLIGERWHEAREFFTDAGVAAIFWIFSLMALAVLGVFLRLLHLQGAQKQIAELAPQSALEVALWIALSVTAGICEEFVFRGYLQQQFGGLSGRLWVGVVISSLLFGSAHGYEGASGMVMITAYGALFSVLAIKRRNLRAGMIAHGWHDAITGIALAILKRANVPLGVM